jgi:tripartite-type tricarboxylate transporter receptor subunit TctC
MFRVALFAALLSVTPLAYAQETYPTRPINLVVAFPPGGVADLTARPLAMAMQKNLGQPVVVVNRTGAGGAIGYAAVAKAPADGYTLLLALSSVSFFPVTDRINERQPAYELNEFAPIALISSDPTVLVTRVDGPFKTFQDFLDEVKKPGRTVRYSSAGVYSALHVPMEIFAQAANVEMLHVPYQGGGPAVAALLGGEVDVLASGPAAAIAQIKGGKIRALASWGDKRIPSLPNVPTFKELGYDAEFYIWAGLLAPAATPPAVQERLRAAVAEAVRDPDFVKAMEKLATPIAFMDAPEFRAFWETDAARLKTSLEKIGKAN